MADIEETNKESGTCGTEQPRTDSPQPQMTLAERANLARNLYALDNWLRNHLQP